VSPAEAPTDDAGATATSGVPAPFVGVALDLPVDRVFTYRVPEAARERARPGHRVRVSFRGRERLGVIVEGLGSAEHAQALEVQEIPDAEPLLGPDLLELGRFVARYYGASFGEALATMVPRGVREKGKGAWRVRVRLLAAALPEGETEEPGPRARILRHLAGHPEGMVLGDLCRIAKVSRSPVDTLARRGVVSLERERAAADPLLEAAGARPADEEPVDRLTDEQAAALAKVGASLDAGTFAPFLLLGVTGSGKTEVYLRAIERCRSIGRQAIVLVPEIALTPQTVRRFRARFDRVAVLHSRMTDADRAESWQRIRRGEVDVVIGPRSAVFAPVPRLGLLVVDEEHEGSFKQQNAPRYHARDVGLVRARAAGAVVLLGSATPALETYRNAREGRYGLLRLTQRAAGAPLPPVQVVDLRSGDERSGGRFLSRTMQVRIREALAGGGQVMLLQNRRGFATSVSCGRCGFVARCKECDVGLTYHRADRIALCHLCGHEEPPPRHCPDCALPDLRFHGAGTETVEGELSVLFPEARVARMDSDTMTTREAYEEVLGRFQRREVDVLVGTQMIAKGLHFPAVTLVGIVSADTSLVLPDFRSAERTFSLVAQVAGRCGRGEGGGRVVVQTLSPEHPAIRAAAEHDYESFAAEELEDRRAHGYPPFTRLLRVVVRGPDAEAVRLRAEALARRLDGLGEGVAVLGPAVPTVARVQGLFRRHLLVKAPNAAAVSRALHRLRTLSRPTGRTEEVWDVDPVGVL
jgi:primosomal protein N' (replication factor Y)